MATGSRFHFEGTIDGTPFEGGTGEDVPLVIGSGQFIPGFEEQPRWAQGRRQQDLRRQIPRRLSRHAILPARTRPSRSP